jgi:hypothetical protein
MVGEWENLSFGTVPPSGWQGRGLPLGGSGWGPLTYCSRLVGISGQ